MEPPRIEEGKQRARYNLRTMYRKLAMCNPCTETVSMNRPRDTAGHGRTEGRIFSQMRRTVAALLLAAVTFQATLGAIDGKKAAYFGGTFAAFASAKDPIEGHLDTTNPDALVLTAEAKPFAGQALTIPYSQIIDIEYGQKAGRRVGAAVATTVLLGPIGLVTLFSKKRKHYMTLGYRDEQGKEQVAVIELGKDLVRATLPIVEKRSGKMIEYQDDEARKASKG